MKKIILESTHSLDYTSQLLLSLIGNFEGKELTVQLEKCNGIDIDSEYDCLEDQGYIELHSYKNIEYNKITKKGLEALKSFKAR